MSPSLALKMFLQNGDIYMKVYTALQLRRPISASFTAVRASNFIYTVVANTNRA
jgi:hypothetical protein